MDRERDPGLVGALFANGGISGWVFNLGVHQRVWWIDGGEHPPLVIVAGTPSTDRSFQAQADALLATLVIGEPQPHPQPMDGF